MRAIIENMISPDYVLCFIPQFWKILGKKVKNLEFTAAALCGFGNFRENFVIFGNYGKSWKITSYNFPNRKQICIFSTAGALEVITI